MKLTEIRGEKALDMWAELIEPIAEIAQDKALAKEVRSGMTPLKFIPKLIKGHKVSVIKILAILDDVPVDEYMESLTFITLPAKVYEVINNPDLISLFTLQSQMEDVTASASALESTEDR